MIDMKNCKTCRYYEKPVNLEPCNHCLPCKPGTYPSWESRWFWVRWFDGLVKWINGWGV